LFSVIFKHADPLAMHVNDQGFHGSQISKFNPKALAISSALPNWQLGLPFSKSMMKRNPVPEVMAKSF
jgi:hypothetical protein